MPALSPKLRAFLETLEAKHSGLEQAEKALRTSGCLRRDPIETNVSFSVFILYCPMANSWVNASTPSSARIQ